MKEIFLRTSDNIQIAINHYDVNRDEVLIIAHGWYMCKDSKVFKSISEDFFKKYDVITLDFRGHGRSSGFYTFSAKEDRDLKVVVDYAKSKYSKVNLLGFSLGSAISIIHTAKNKDINKLIVVSAPASFKQIENHFWKKEAFMPTIKKFELFRALSIRPGNILLKKVNPINIIQNVSTIPILLIAGEKDPIVYPSHAEKLYNKARPPKSMLILEGGYHAEDLYLGYKEKFLSICMDWIENGNK